MTMTIRTIVGTILAGLLGWVILFFAWQGVKATYYIDFKGYRLCPPKLEGVNHAVMPNTVIEGGDMAEQVIDTGMENSVVVASFHFFPDYDELNFEWNTMWKDPDDPDAELWGWSNCEWQPKANVAFCDIYTIRPTFVHGDMAMDTIGHEVWHGVTGDFHE